MDDAFTVLGIDPGLSVTGYGVVLSDSGCHEALTFGTIRPSQRLSTEQKLKAIHEGLANVIARWRPQQVAVEDFIVGHARAAVTIGEARAMALLAAAQAGLPVYLYKPSEVKQSITSYGRGTKDQVARMVRVLLGVDRAPLPEDAADALAVALCHCLRRHVLRITNG